MESKDIPKKEMNQEVQKILESMNLSVEDGKITFNLDSFEQSLNELKASNESVILDDSARGLRVELHSRNQKMPELKTMAIETFSQLNNKSKKIPLGVG